MNNTIYKVLNEINRNSIETTNYKYEQYLKLLTKITDLNRMFKTKFYIAHGYLVKGNTVVNTVFYIYHPDVEIHNYCFKDDIFFMSRIPQNCDTLNVSEHVVKLSILSIV